MAYRQREWAEKATRALRNQLGGECEACGKKRGLEFDCIAPAGHRHHRIEWSARLSFYRAMFRDGNLQLLCTRCHAAKTRVDARRAQLQAALAAPLAALCAAGILPEVGGNGGDNYGGAQ